MKIVDYHIIQDCDENCVASRVLTGIELGWQLFGGASIGVDPSGDTIFCQTMVKYELSTSEIAEMVMRNANRDS